MWDRLLILTLQRVLREGRLHLTLPDGRSTTLGRGGAPEVAVRLHDPALPRRILLNPELALGEAYVDGALTVAGDDLRALITLAMRNAGQGRGAIPPPLGQILALRRRLLRLARRNPMTRARQNVAHHYDLGPALYDLFLGPSKQYTCAYFRQPDAALDQAQTDKMALIGAKLLLRPGMRVLDIGCGFGTLALTLARDHGVHVTGITLSEVQLAEARARAAAAGLAERLEFRLQDYRAVTGTFDRVVSVGMMEHVGEGHLGAYFAKVANLLAPEGVALIHYIGRFTPPDAISPWFRKYIFPGAYCPALSEVLPRVEHAGLILTDLEVWRGHYERTLRAWLANFDANIDAIRTLYDDRFIRLWRFYLLSAELSFSDAALVIHQLQLSRARGVVPMTRDYLCSDPA